MELGVFGVDLFQAIIGDAGSQVVDVMVADVAGEPLQEFGQLVIRTALHGGADEVPLLIWFPVGVLELMLDIEKPDAYAGRDEEHGEENFQERQHANPPHEEREGGDDGGVGDVDVALVARAVLYRVTDHTINLEEQHERAAQDEADRIAIDAIA